MSISELNNKLDNFDKENSLFDQMNSKSNTSKYEKS